jgi:aryl-alcohol dehydrogenase-like predicted oxidoreductase
MRYRQLGRTGLTVSEVGFGTWGLGGDAYGAIDEPTSLSTLAAAFDRGVTYYDTSDVYGNGRCEELLGAAFAGRRSRVVIGSKVGALPHTGLDMPQDFSPTNIRRKIDESLRRLRTDYIDLYHLHSPALTLPNWDDVLSVFETLRRVGKIRAYAIAARSPADAKLAIDRYRLPAVQVNFNMIDQRAVDVGLFDLCRAERVGVIARTPLCFGYLSGNLTGDEDFQSDDHRARWPERQRRLWAKAAPRLSVLNDRTDRSLVQLALQFCLAEAAVSTVIPGMLSRDHVRENTVVSELTPLTDAEMAVIRRVYQSDTFYDPTAKTTATPDART